MTDEEAARQLEGAGRAFCGEVPDETQDAIRRGAHALRARGPLVEALEAANLMQVHGATRQTAKALGVLDDFLAHGPHWLRQYVQDRRDAALALAKERP